MRIYKDGNVFVLDGENSIHFLDEASSSGACITIDLPSDDMRHFRIENFGIIMRRDEDRETFMQRLRSAWNYLWQKEPTWWDGMKSKAMPYTMSTQKP